MTPNRKRAEEVAIKWVNKIDLSGHNGELLKTQFSNLSDEQFENWIEALRAKKDYVPIVIPNNSSVDVTVDNNLKVAKELGVEIHRKVFINDPDTGIRYKTPIPYMVVHMPIRRQIETIESKISVADNNTSIDALTGQPVGVSKGGSLSFPESLVLTSMGLSESILELIKVRGGDDKAYNHMVRSINESGGASLTAASNLGSRAKVTQSLSTIFTAMHFENTV